MKQFFQSIITIIMVCAIAACAPVEDDLFTTAHITVAAGDDLTITRVQGQVKLTNVNTRQVTTSADFGGASVTVELLRGASRLTLKAWPPVNRLTGLPECVNSVARATMPSLSGKSRTTSH